MTKSENFLDNQSSIFYNKLNKLNTVHEQELPGKEIKKWYVKESGRGTGAS